LNAKRSNQLNELVNDNVSNKTVNRLFSITFALLCLFSQSIYAHEIKPAIANLHFSAVETGPKLRVELLVNAESLMAEIGPDHDDTKESANSAMYETFRGMNSISLLNAFGQFQHKFLNNINLSDSNGTPIPLVVEMIDIPEAGDVSLARDTRITLRASSLSGVNAVVWQWDAAFGEVIVRANNETQTLDYAALLSPGQSSDPIHFTAPAKQSPWQVIANYIVVGFEHILPKGLDHILFVIGLFLLTTQWRALILQVTTFTVAHSITLALGATKTLVVAPEIVEPLIALSIVFVCVENLFTTRLHRWRLVMVFTFGLLHGLGFASVLEAVGLDDATFVIALLGFNIGVELGQLFVVAICMLAIGTWFGKKANYHKLFSKPASVVIGCIGLFWFVQRTIL